MTINVGVIGFGLSAKIFHLPFIDALPSFAVKAIGTSQQQLAKQAWPNAVVFTQVSDLLADKNIDLVVITSPNDSHYHLAKQALLAHKHVVVEKPFTVTVAQADELIDLAKQQGRVLTVYHNRRLDGDFLTVKDCINQGQLGNVRMLHSRFDRFRPEVRNKWKEQSGQATGILYDLGSHLIDQALQLFGQPQAITAQCLAMRNGSQAVDYFDVLLHYPDLQVRLGSSPFNAGVNQRFMVHGDLGSLLITGVDAQEAQIVAGMTFNDPMFADNSEQKVESSLASVAIKKGNYHKFYQQLATAINSGTAPLVSAESARNVIAIIELAMQSSEQQRTLAIRDYL
ncbi:oxidoreductase [Thalassotalea maritima]|uniref:oxidoreductase n=1 Tax=Thalassotalea maritima TaxID=3242416 RepID=UPI003528EC57